MTTAMVQPREVADLLRDLRRVAELPADDPERQAWSERKRDVFDRITARARLLAVGWVDDLTTSSAKARRA